MDHAMPFMLSWTTRKEREAESRLDRRGKISWLNLEWESRELNNFPTYYREDSVSDTFKWHEENSRKRFGNATSNSQSTGLSALSEASVF